MLKPKIRTDVVIERISRENGLSELAVAPHALRSSRRLLLRHCRAQLYGAWERDDDDLGRNVPAPEFGELKCPNSASSIIEELGQDGCQNPDDDHG